MEIEMQQPGAGDAGLRSSHGRAEGLTGASDTMIADRAQRAAACLPAWVRTVVDTAAAGDAGVRRAHCRSVAWVLQEHGWTSGDILALAARGAPFARGVDDLASVLSDLSGDGAAPQSTGAGLTISRCMADVEMVPVRWLWPDRIALGKIGLLAGLPGLGKSQLSCAMVAAVTSGGQWPDGAYAPRGSAIMIACEHDAGDTIGPRLTAAGADLTRVHILDWVRRGEAREHFDVRRHGLELTDLIARVGDVRLVVIDPITAYLGRVDSHVAADVRSALAPLQMIAAETDVAVILISHLNKGAADGSAMARISGSGAFVAVSRSAWLVAPDPGDSAGQRRILAPVKNNLAAAGAALAFTIERVPLHGGIATSRVAFDPTPVETTADELLQKAAPDARTSDSALGRALAFLRDELADGPKEAKAVEDTAAVKGVTKATLVRARKAAGVEAQKRGATGPWVLSLPIGEREDGA